MTSLLIILLILIINVYTLRTFTDSNKRKSQNNKSAIINNDADKHSALMNQIRSVKRPLEHNSYLMNNAHSESRELFNHLPNYIDENDALSNKNNIENDHSHSVDYFTMHLNQRNLIRDMYNNPNIIGYQGY